MANATKTATENTKATANKEVKSMSKTTTKTASAVGVVKTKSVPAVKTEAKVEAPKTETKNVTKINITMDEVEKLFTEAGIGFKHNNCNYRIITGGSSLNVHKHRFAFYMTDVDFEKVKSLKAADIECVKDGNKQAHTRPNSVFFTTVETLKMVIGAIAPKKLATA